MIYFNEIEPYPQEWLCNLFDCARDTRACRNTLDTRSISDVLPDHVDGFTRCHFFAGIGGWEYALQLAGWPAGREVWTGSCPCQPLSCAGKRKGHEDERHLWPEFYRLIRECRPPTIFGEQVAAKDGREWLDGVFDDLEDLGYACGAADLCAASAGAPHIRQRLFWVADSEGGRLGEHGRTQGSTGHADECGEDGRLAQPNSGINRRNVQRPGQSADPNSVQSSSEFAGPSHSRGMDDATREQVGRTGQPREDGAFWGDYTLIPCADGKARRVESGTFPLAHGVPARVGKLRAYGNAIVPQVAAAFVTAFMESVDI